MTRRHRFFALLLLATLWLGLGNAAYAGSATSVAGLYYTGSNSSGGLVAGGGRDANWQVTYARVNGTNYTGTSTYTGAAYVLSSSYIDAAYVANTSSAQWITAPGASTAGSGGTTNVGGDYLPGNGTSGTNSAYYVYRLAFTVTGTGSGTVTNNIQIAMTLAALMWPLPRLWQEQVRAHLQGNTASELPFNPSVCRSIGTKARRPRCANFLRAL